MASLRMVLALNLVFIQISNNMSDGLIMNYNITASLNDVDVYLILYSQTITTSFLENALSK